jgi:hypothetical protein
MASKISVINRVQSFLEDYQHLAGSRDGYPKIALDLQSVRDLINESARLVERERHNAWYDGFDSSERGKLHCDSWSYEDYLEANGIK